MIVRVEPDLDFLLREWTKTKYGDKVEWAYLYPPLNPKSTLWFYLKVALHISNTINQAYPNRERIIGIFDFPEPHLFFIVDKNCNRTGEKLMVEDPEFFSRLEKQIEKALGEFGE